MKPVNTYDNLEVGDSFTWSRRITFEEVQQFADVTGDDNPIHVDREYAQQTPFGKPLVHGAFLIAVASKVFGHDFPGPGSVAVSLKARFLRPVPAGSEIRMEVKVIEKIERFRHVKLRLYAYTDGKIAGQVDVVTIPPEPDVELPDREE